MAMPPCYRHETAEAIDTCSGCLKPVCAICSTFLSARVYCPPCGRRARRRRLVVWLVFASMLVGGAGAVVFHLATREPPFDYGKDQKQFDKLAAQLEKEPCDRDKTVEFADLMLSAGNYRGAAERCEEFFRDCGEHLRLRWITYGSYKRLSEFEAALREVSKLIEAYPNDKDFRWWRGLVYEKMEKLEEAAADYRQAISIEPRLDSIPFNLADIYERQGKPCEALFPIEQYLHHHPEDRRDPGILRRLERLQLKGKCDELIGEGKAVIRFPPSAPSIRVRPRVNNKPGDFILDTGASYVTFSREFAEAAGVDVDGSARILVNTADGIRAAHLTVADTIQVQGLTSKRVPAVVLDGLSGGIDGLLGLSFLARYSLTIDRDAGRIEISTGGQAAETGRR